MPRKRWIKGVRSVSLGELRPLAGLQGVPDTGVPRPGSSGAESPPAAREGAAGLIWPKCGGQGRPGPGLLTPGAELGSREDWGHPCLRCICEISGPLSGLRRWTLRRWESVDAGEQRGLPPRQRGAEDHGFPWQFSQQSAGPSQLPLCPSGCSYPRARLYRPAIVHPGSYSPQRRPLCGTEVGPSPGFCVHLRNPRRQDFG